jgi:hypothetical protein
MFSEAIVKNRLPNKARSFPQLLRESQITSNAGLLGKAELQSKSLRAIELRPH